MKYDLGHGRKRRKIVIDHGLDVVWVAPDGRRELITERRLEALELSLKYGQQEAAGRMGCSVQTVKNHLQTLYRQLGVRTASQAAIAVGWLKLPHG